jgi:hypothetical protein
MADQHKQKIYIKSFQKFLEVTGLVHYSTSKSEFMKLLWIFAYVSGLGFTIYLLNASLKSYLGRETTTLISKVHSNTPIPFPAITICNINPFNEKYANQYIQEVLSRNEESYCSKKSFYETLNCLNNNTRPNKVLHTFVDRLKRILANAENHDYYGYKLEDMLVNCEYNSIPCSVSDFSTFWSQEYGNCYTFNKTEPLTTSVVGDKYGLKLELVVSKLKKTYLSITMNLSCF